MPLSVLLNVEVISGLNDALAAGLQADPARGVEVGGILLGRVDEREPAHPIIHIEKFDPIESEHRHGPSFLLTDRDKLRLRNRLAWWSRRRRSGLRPVGFYRSHTRPGLYLDNGDFSVIRGFFPDRRSVFLLVRPAVPDACSEPLSEPRALASGSQTVAGFFFWEQGDIHRQSSYLQFPFDPVRLPLLTPAPIARPAKPARSAPVPSRVRLGAAIAAGLLLVSTLIFLLARMLVLPPWTAAVSAQPPHPARAAAAHDTPSPFTAGTRAPGTRPPVAVASSPVAAVSVPPSDLARPVEKPSPFKPSPLIGGPAPGSRSNVSPAAALAPPVEKPSPSKLKPVAPALIRRTPPARVAAAKVPLSNPSRPVPNASRSQATLEPLPAPPPEPPPPPPAIAALNVPAGVESPLPPPMHRATVTVEPVSESKLGHLFGKIPGLRRREKKDQSYVPARPVREISPALPAGQALAHDVPVDLKVTIDPAGKVSDIEPTRRADRRLVRLATDAARAWQFEPARRNDETVSSELILHFTFRPSN